MIGEARAILGKPGAFVEKYLFWEATVANAKSSAVANVVELLLGVSGEEFDFSRMTSTEWLLSKNSAELAAYRQGAADFAILCFSVFVRNFGEDVEEFLRNAIDGDEREVRVRILLDAAAELSGRHAKRA